MYSEEEITISSGIGGVTLLPRSEDPLADLTRLAQFIDETLKGTPPDPNEKFQGDLTREELASLGDVLTTITLPATILDSNTVRKLYEIETIITIVDDLFFGQTVSGFDLNIQEDINRRIEVILTPPAPPPSPPGGDEIDDTPETGGIPVSASDCFLVQHVAQPEIPSANTPSPSRQSPNSPVVTGGFNQSGQCLFCNALLPLAPAIRPQLPTSVVTFFNANDWVPQIKKRLTTGHTVTEVLAELDIIDHETPFGSSQLFDAIRTAATTTTGDTFESIKKVFYIGSDNSENFSLITRDQAIEDVNAVDGDKKSPVVYSLFSTSFPVSLAAQLERTEVGDIEKIVQATGGQSSTLIATGFLDQILNRTIGGATGGLGWGKYIRTLDLGELSAVTEVATAFVLPANTQGFLRFRHSEDGFNFTDFTERFEGSQTIDFIDFFAKLVEFEIILTTGFTVDITEEYDSTPTGIPKLTSITWTNSGEREDFMFLNSEKVLTNAQQVAAAFDGSIPTSSIVEIGVATSDSNDWRDFQSAARPALEEFGKTFLLERAENTASLVPVEPLTSRDGLLYTTTYGSWDPGSSISLFKVNSAGNDVPVLTGFQLHPRDGSVYFDTRQSPSTVFKLAVVNEDTMRVGLRLRNRLHTDSIVVQGIGYIYSTNDVKPIELSQVAPQALNPSISPQSPTAGDTIFALYDYVDLNGEPESGTLIRWFKNGTQLFEINNKSSWTNSDLQTQNRLSPNDKLYFTVTPSDGRDFGTVVFSPTATVIAQAPIAQDLTVIPIRGGVENNRFDTGSIFRAQYDFTTNDIGSSAQESGTLIEWFVEESIFKSGIFPDPEASLDPRDITVGERVSGVPAHVIGNIIRVEVTPRTSFISGAKQVSDTFTVANSVPLISGVKITAPDDVSAPTTLTGLKVNYTIDDPDFLDPTLDQSDQSEITWFISLDGVVFTTRPEKGREITPLATSTLANTVWTVSVQGRDGLDIGPTIISPPITILPA